MTVITASRQKIIRLLELARIEPLLAAVSNIWLITFLAFGIESSPQRNPALDAMGPLLAILLATIVAVGLVSCAMMFNDVIDARYDRRFAPDRPIPSGRISMTSAVIATIVCLLVTMAAAAAFGTASMLLALIVVIGILFYNLVGRFMPAVGVVSFGLSSAGAMLVANPRPAVVWPVAVMMTHVMVCATLRYWLAGKRPRLSVLDGWGICLGRAFWTLLLVSQTNAQMALGKPRAIWTGPIILLFAFIGIGTRLLVGKIGPERSRRNAGRRFIRWAILWLIFYNAAWLLSAGLLWQGTATLGLFGAVWVLNRSKQLLTATVSPRHLTSL